MLQAIRRALNAGVFYFDLDGRSTQAGEAGYAVCELPEGKSHIWHLAGNLALAHFQRRADKDSAAEPRVPGN